MKNQISKIFITSLLMLTCINSQAQLSKVEGTLSARKATSLHIGDYVPDRDFKVSNSKEKQLNLANFKGKWILLDLWGVYCGTCIQHMPDAEELQRKYQDKLKVVMVSRNTDQQVQKLAKLAENVRNNKLPFINGPDQLSGLFDFSFVPQYIWINPAGRIRYMTNDQFSVDTVKNILDGKNYQVTEKKTILFDHTDVPIITNLYPLFGNNFYVYSYLAPSDNSNYDYDVPSRSSLGFNGLPKTESGVFSFKQLYKAAYSFSMENNPLPDERVIINFDDTVHYSDPVKNYDYEIIVHKNIPEQRVRKYMQTQFDLFFNVSSHLEKRLVPCLVFKRLNNGRDCVTNEKDTTAYDRYGDHMLRAITHWKALFSYLNFTYVAPPHTVIDETGITADKVVKLNISIDFDHLEKMNKSLESYGLTIIQENRMMDCIIIDNASN